SGESPALDGRCNSLVVTAQPSLADRDTERVAGAGDPEGDLLPHLGLRGEAGSIRTASPYRGNGRGELGDLIHLRAWITMHRRSRRKESVRGMTGCGGLLEPGMKRTITRKADPRMTRIRGPLPAGERGAR